VARVATVQPGHGSSIETAPLGLRQQTRYHQIILSSGLSVILPKHNKKY
jgi:hypothetical protein